ncbi:amidase [Yamadazyma tenuis]|uniref:amidase n=1 Tax=Candida tenuis (strain ATCC 10573 / BCRC 21748 / CBS 615 / JCM 9827 / NBRC 10315 / NRRL Y-1498 / VKM Y-70) TaxID=590646 RepID=G3B5B3_CANTC|nr:amidase [Yamadazyma tenuis ATCC 10573]EGV63174.1 amidase [Yamadazyma tenuis ATCC 10573]WEJ97001.1 amidase [Yamadazyma tenuis]
MSQVTYESLLVNDPLTGYDDAKKYAEFVPKLEAYREKLINSIDPEYAIVLPKPIEELYADQFNAIKYLYDEKLLSEEELAITNSSGTDLAKKIASGELKSVTVYKAFAKRGTICHQLTNCALEIFTDEGLERAEYLDKYYEQNGTTVGPFHGLPISLKEHLFYKNKVCHGCFVGNIEDVSEVHGVTTQILENLGAVFYIRTNQPQTLMHLCSDNNYIGCTRNPYNLGLSPGGSSSGEGALVSFGGSVAGVGTDIGGSIRAPAAFSGCFGLRPSTKRISVRGGSALDAGQESVIGVAGPMTRSVDDIDMWMKHYINDGKPWLLDEQVINMPWKEVAPPKPSEFTVAIMYDNDLLKTTPPIARGLKETAAKLENAGVKIVEFKPIKSKLAYDVVHQMYTADGNIGTKACFQKSGEPIVRLTKNYLNYGKGSKGLTVTENRELNDIRNELRQEYTEFLVKNDIDFIISPTYANVAPKPKEIYNWSYTSLFNILDFPTLVFQTGLFQDPKVDKWDDSFKDYKFRSPSEELELTSYDPKEFVGAPIGLQLSGKRYTDEDVVAAGKTIVDILGVNLLK